MEVFPLIQSGAILPLGKDIPLKGKSTSSATITLYLNDEMLSQCPGEPAWELNLPAQKAGGPHQLKFTQGNESLEFSDIYFGKVFLLAGQSNMELPIERCLDKFPLDFTSYEDLLIRELRLPIEPSFDESESAWSSDIEWKALQAEHLMEMGALGVSLAIHYREENPLPIGLINGSAGGTTQESWIAMDYLSEMEEELLNFAKSKETRELILDVEERRVQAWYKAGDAQSKYLDQKFSIDKARMFYDTPIHESNYCGLAHVTHQFTLSAEEYAAIEKSETVILHLGTIDNHDRAFLNGTAVGETFYQYPPRKYPVDKSLFNNGENDIFIELYIARNPGGLIEDKFYGIETDSLMISFTNPWHIAWAGDHALSPMAYGTFWNRYPSTNYLAYLKDLKGFPIDALFWYQGESNGGNTLMYKRYLQQYIKNMQDDYGLDLPFFLIQLPKFEDPARGLGEDSWARLREVQREVAEELASYLIVSIDLGEANDLHPQDKWNLGKRCSDAYVQHEAGVSAVEANLCPREIEWAEDKVSIDFMKNIIVPQNILQSFKAFNQAQLVSLDSFEVFDTKLIIKAEGVIERLDYLYENCPEDIYIVDENTKPYSPFSIKK